MSESAPDEPEPRLLVSLCTYNERKNLEPLVPEIFAQVPRAELLILDDGSPDGTGAFADALAEADARIHVIHRAGKLGLGSATVAVLRFALEGEYDIWLNLDADFSHHPRFIPDLLNGLQHADIVIGSRYVTGGGVEGWGLKRHLMSRTINAYARLTLGLQTRDNSGSYRCYRLEKLRGIDLTRFRSNGYAVQEELLYRCRAAGCTFLEKPIIFDDRRHGESKINRREAARAVRDMARLMFDRVRGTPVLRG
jgi:dolichol-phosphate mannosyltransferase